MGAKRKRCDPIAHPHAKLARVPERFSIQKRPLLRAPVPSKYANTEVKKIVYVSTKTPFMSAVKRVQRLLEVADIREAQSALASVRRRSKDDGKRRPDRSRETADLDEATTEITSTRARKPNAWGGHRDEVVVKGTGRAIEKTLGVALFFQQRDGFAVTLRTGSVAAIDDIVDLQGDLPTTTADDATSTEATADGAAGESDGDLRGSSTRLRYTSVVEVFVSRS